MKTTAFSSPRSRRFSPAADGRTRKNSGCSSKDDKAPAAAEKKEETPKAGEPTVTKSGLKFGC